jgi:hypothetical protein
MLGWCLVRSSDTHGYRIYTDVTLGNLYFEEDGLQTASVPNGIRESHLHQKTLEWACIRKNTY